MTVRTFLDAQAALYQVDFPEESIDFDVYSTRDCMSTMDGQNVGNHSDQTDTINSGCILVRFYFLSRKIDRKRLVGLEWQHEIRS